MAAIESFAYNPKSLKVALPDLIPAVRISEF